MFQPDACSANLFSRVSLFRLIVLVAAVTAFSVRDVRSQTIAFDNYIRASENPFGTLPGGTDTIIVRDTFEIDINYYPILSNGVPFDGKLVLDGGVLYYSGNWRFTLGPNSRMLLYSGGNIYPGKTADVGCNDLKTLYFDTDKLASCSGVSALHSFADVNSAGCFDGNGICCDATIYAVEQSGYYNDGWLCTPGDSVKLSVQGSGSLSYSYFWSPNIGQGPGPHKVTPLNNTTYNVSISGIFDPEGAAPPYLLTCGNSFTVRINPSMTLVASATSVPCAASLTGTIDLTVLSGSGPYQYRWSNGATTQDLNNLAGGDYSVVVTDARGCTAVKNVTVPTQDNVPPTLTCPADTVDIVFPNQCFVYIGGLDAVFTDNCPGAQLSYVVSGASSYTGNGQLPFNLEYKAGSNLVTYKVDDGNNEVTCTFTVIAIDDQFPSASNPPILTGVQCFTSLPAPDPAVITGETDNCGPPTVTYEGDIFLGGSGCPGDPLIVSRKYRVTDSQGNGVNLTQRIEVADSQPPVFIQVPANITVNCISIPPVGTVQITDNCSLSPTAIYQGQTRTNGPCPDTYILKRTWLAQDECGNTSVAVQNISVVDNTPPLFTNVPANITVECQSIPAPGTATAVDVCDANVTLNYMGENRIDGSCPGNYTLRRTWRAEDNCGNVATAEQLITVQDIKNPVFTIIPGDETVSCESVPLVGLPIATDNCDPLVDIIYQGQVRTDGACANTYTLLRTWQAVDHCGNTATATQLLTVRDFSAPVFTSVPADATVSCEAIPPVGTPVASDNCDTDVTIVYQGETRTNGACPGAFLLRRRWTATDNCGNTASAVQTFTVQDTTGPVFTFIPPNTNVACDSLPTLGTPQATDNCDPAVDIVYIGETRVDGVCPNSFVLRRRWQATDDCGNTSIGEQVLFVGDLSAPVFSSAPQSQTVGCDNVPPPGQPIAVDDCTPSVSVVYNGETRTNGSCPYNYALLRKWTATDACGNTTTVTQQLIVKDSIAPFFTTVPPNFAANCDNIPPVGVPVAFDNCALNVSIAYLGQTTTNGSCPGNYLLTRTWSATDVCGNTKTATQVINVQDVVPPVVSFVPADVVVSCSAVPAVGSPVASDNCDAAPQIAFDGDTRIDGACSDSYILKRKWTITDNCGNSTTAVQTISVQDITPPSFSFVPVAVTANCDAVPVPGSPVASDNCDSDVTITYDGDTRTDGSCPGNYTLLRKWTATDNCGNTTTATQTIFVRDITPPVYTALPDPVVINCTETVPVGAASASDNCDANVFVVYSGQVRIDGNCTNNYTLRRSWVATDHCGNTALGVQEITVQDTIAPLFTFVPDATTASCDAVPFPGAPTAADNCDVTAAIAYLGESRTDGLCPSNYTLTRTWSASDDCGNFRTAQQVITVQDVTIPVFTFIPKDTLVNCDAVPAPGMPLSIDNCTQNPAITLISQTTSQGSSSINYFMYRVWAATDACGNSSTALQTLTVQDTISPQVQCPPDMTVDADASACLAVVDYPLPTTIDNCASLLNTDLSTEPGDSLTVGVHKVDVVVSDPTGNAAFCNFTITVRDTTPPVLLNCPADFTLSTSPDSCTVKAFWTIPAVTDPCDLYPIVPFSNIPNGTELPVGTKTVVYTAVDTSGNATLCSFAITVRENVPPVIIDCPQDTSVFAETCFAQVDWVPPTAVDNCSDVTLTSTYPPNTSFPETQTVVRYTATDIWGNTSTCEFIVNIVDIIPPALGPCPPDRILTTDSCSRAVFWTLPIATDNCTANQPVFSEPPSGYEFPVGFTTVKIYTEDQTGNRDSCTFTVEIIGKQIDMANIPSDQSYTGCEAVAFWTPPTLVNICGPYTFTSNYEPGDTFYVGTTEVRYILKDTLNNTVTANFFISVTESVPPVFTCPASPVKVNVSGAVLSDPSGFITSTDTVATCDGVDLTFLFPQATDNCTLPVVTQTGGGLTASAFGLGMNTLKFMAQDEAGNTAVCEVEIEVLPLLQLAPQVSDLIACEGDEVVLTATSIPGAVYTWTGPKGPYPTTSDLMIIDLDASKTGIYQVSANVNGCITPVDSALVRIGKLPEVSDDLDFEVATSEDLLGISVLDNDIYEEDDYVFELIEPFLSGLTDLGNGVFNFSADGRNIVHNFFYRICSRTCPDLCDDAVVAITARERVCEFVPNTITPNGDGINDYLIIPCLDIESYPQNNLVIYNQWGDEVYEASPYNNAPDRAWRGELRGREGQPLPDATYYFLFRPSPQHSVLKGFIQILR